MFVVTVRGERLNASYNIKAISDAIIKAESLIALGAVVITDPRFLEFTPAMFDELRDYWKRANDAAARSDR